MRVKSVAFSVVLAGIIVSGSAFAQSSSSAAPAGRTPASTVVVSTSDYTETRVAGDQVVTFPGDELPGTGPSPYGDTIRRPPVVMRHGLITPRLNFVSELLKSVEHL